MRLKSATAHSTVKGNENPKTVTAKSGKTGLVGAWPKSQDIFLVKNKKQIIR